MVIEKDVPIPPKHARAQGVAATLSRMQKGDSFLLDSEDACRHAHGVAKRNGMKITTRKVEGGWRVWKIE